MVRSVRRLMVAAIGVTLAVLSIAGPAHALATNNLVFESVILGAGGGGNLTDAQVAALIASNEALLGVDIDLIGSIDNGTGVFSPADPKFAGTFVSATCITGSFSTCNDGFTVTFDFTTLVEEWQIVKVSVKADGPTYPNGNFVADSLQTAPLDNIQAGFVSSAEWDAYVAAACAFPGNTGPCPQGAGSSHLLVFGSPTAAGVPEPGTLILLGLGLVGLGVAGRKRIRA